MEIIDFVKKTMDVQWKSLNSFSNRIAFEWKSLSSRRQTNEFTKQNIDLNGTQHIYRWKLSSSRYWTPLANYLF